MNNEVDGFISQQRDLLNRLEAFSRSPQFQVLAKVGREVFQEPSDYELARWLLQPVYGLDTRPLEMVEEPGGLAQVIDRLQRILHGFPV